MAVVDDAGDTVRLRAPARRIVSLIPTTTEILVSAGLAERVVGRTEWCDWPAAAAAIPSVGGGFPPNVEAVAARRPDLVVLYRTAANGPAAAQLEASASPCSRSAPTASPTFRASLGCSATLAGGNRRRRIGRARVRARSGRRFGRACRRPTGRPARLPSLLLAWPDPTVALGAGRVHERAPRARRRTQRVRRRAVRLGAGVPRGDRRAGSSRRVPRGRQRGAAARSPRMADGAARCVPDASSHPSSLPSPARVSARRGRTPAPAHLAGLDRPTAASLNPSRSKALP